MAILFVGSRAADLGGGTIQDTNSNFYDSNYCSESAEVEAIFIGGASGFSIAHDEPVSGTVWYHFNVYTGSYMASSNVDGYWFDLVDASGTLLGRYNCTDGIHRAQVYGDTTEESVDAMLLAEKTLQTIDVKFTAGANLEMSVYLNGTLQMTATAANTGGLSAPRRINFDHDDFVHSASSHNLKFYYSEFIITDNESTIGWHLATLLPAADGNYNNWNGGFADIQAVNDGLALSVQTTNQRQSWTLSSYGGPASTSAVRAVINSFNGNAGAGGTGPQNIAPFIRHASTDVDGSNLTLGQNVLIEYTVNPQTSLAWDTADLATLEVGVISKV